MSPMLTLSQQFATLIDQTRFDEAAELLAEECQYHYWEGNYSGRKNIANIYRHLYEFTKKMFDEAIPSSEIEPLDGSSCRVHFKDQVRIGELWHESRFDQVLRFEDGLIVDIREVQIPGEAEAMQEFFKEANSPFATTA
ncbi:MAG: nuclear transport factor 2 family protein [Bacteroidota bacterium]|nr:nuclear transport factor 2 family protein [Bacteroidota bacterium]MDP4234751.1 nuclear transport factor 2 family protein [Bacteroidota bacterium]MDP4242643.1 nuclear transport factor 2 family protein [Bacteroidota bacterium]MDP4286795.1 nuclear transport factor 2 family protein [Bacteroidota bacterium]